MAGFKTTLGRMGTFEWSLVAILVVLVVLSVVYLVAMYG